MLASGFILTYFSVCFIFTMRLERYYYFVIHTKGTVGLFTIIYHIIFSTIEFTKNIFVINKATKTIKLFIFIWGSEQISYRLGKTGVICQDLAKWNGYVAYARIGFE